MRSKIISKERKKAKLSTILAFFIVIALAGNLSVLDNSFVYAQSSIDPPDTLWATTYGETRPGGFTCSVIQTSDGGYALAGVSDIGDIGSALLVKFDSSGNKQWRVAYDGAGLDWANSVIQTSDGGYVIAGGTLSLGHESRNDDQPKSNGLLIKTDSEGNIQWNKAYGDVGDDQIFCVIQTSDGGYAFAGEKWSSKNISSVAWLVKVDSAGNMQWDKTYLETYMNKAYYIIQTSDGGYVLTGKDAYPWLIKTDAAGNIEWNRTYKGKVIYSELRSIVHTSDGGYALAGYMQLSTNNYDFWLLKTDSSGNMAWNKTYGGIGLDIAYSMVQTSDGGYALAGYTGPVGANGYDFWIIKVDLSGNMQWDKTYGEEFNDIAYSIIRTTDGGYAVAGIKGTSDSFTPTYWLIKIAYDRSVQTVPTNQHQSSPSPSIPEFPTWLIIALLAIIATATSLVYFRRKAPGVYFDKAGLG